MASASSQVENAISQVADGAKEQLSATQEISQQMQENSDISNDVNEKLEILRTWLEKQQKFLIMVNQSL